MMLEYIQSRSLPSCNSIKTIELSTLYYSTIPHSKLKNRLRELVQLCFINKSGQRRYKYLVLGRDRVFGKIPLWFYQKVLWSWYHQHARVFDWQHICFFWWTCFSAESWYIYGWKRCSYSRRLVPLFVWSRLHAGVSQVKRKEASPIL